MHSKVQNNTCDRRFSSLKLSLGVLTTCRHREKEFLRPTLAITMCPDLDGKKSESRVEFPILGSVVSTGLYLNVPGLGGQAIFS